MDEGGIATTHIIRVSGHKSEESVKHYVSRLRDKKKREISYYLNDTLTNPCGQKFADNSAI
jgi:tRNA U34 5-carboxymethylaminomethyl modifying GTPase MnmE/TrmE